MKKSELWNGCREPRDKVSNSTNLTLLATNIRTLCRGGTLRDLASTFALRCGVYPAPFRFWNPYPPSKAATCHEYSRVSLPRSISKRFTMWLVPVMVFLFMRNATLVQQQTHVNSSMVQLWE